MLETSGRNQAISLTGKPEPFLGSDVNPHGRCCKWTSIFPITERKLKLREDRFVAQGHPARQFSAQPGFELRTV